MKLQQITEMAAKKLCPLCGKTMAANHYWYKGGWKCKKSATADAGTDVVKALTPIAPIAKIAPTEQPAAVPAPVTRGATVSADVNKIREMIPELDWQDEGDAGDIYWQVSNHGGKINVSWEYTFKRDTPTGAYAHKQRLINAANVRLAQLANTFPDSLINVRPLTPAIVRAQEQRAESNGESAYSEYEQSIGGYATFLG